MKKVLVRFDDICPTMDMQQWRKAESLLDQYNIKPLLGVIPACDDPELQIDNEVPDFWTWVRKKQENGYAIAMHGLNHVFCSNKRGILTTRIGSEFSGLPYQVQLKKIQKGKEILESHGVYTDIFFAPGHSYDENTIKALAACGFRYVSDGKSSKAYSWHGIKFLPCRNSGAGFSGREGYFTSIYHAHEWVQKEKDAYPFLLNLITREKHSIVDFKTYREQNEGNSYIQRIIECLYVLLQFNVAPVIRKLRR